jgi:hypothetical protein
MLVEVKTKPTTKDVKDHIKRLEKMRKYADLHGDKRTFLGAVAGAVMTDNRKNGDWLARMVLSRQPNPQSSR